MQSSGARYLSHRENIAFFITPFIAAGTWYVYVLGLILVSDGHLDWRPDVLGLLHGAATFGLVVAAALTYVVALPCYALARATVGISGLTARTTGTAIGALTGAALLYLGRTRDPSEAA
jgi:hypothetical protein